MQLDLKGLEDAAIEMWCDSEAIPVKKWHPSTTDKTKNFWRGYARTAITAYLQSATTPSAEVVAGDWQTVPKEPTEEMCRALLDQDGWSVSRAFGLYGKAREFWQAMLAAAPAPVASHEMQNVEGKQPAVTDDRLTAACVALAAHGIPADVQELLIQGNPMRGIPPGAMTHALTAALSAPAAEPVAWQSRVYIGTKWTDWSEINKPLEAFKEYFQFNLDNGTVEIRPLYAAPLPAQGGKADD